MASLRDGSGNEWFAWFKNELFAYKEYSKDDGISPSAKLDLETLGKEYSQFAGEAAFSMDRISAIGYIRNKTLVHLGIMAKRMITVNQALRWDYSDYFGWAQEYYEIQLPSDRQIAMWASPTDVTLAMEVNPDIDLDQLKGDFLEISYDA